MRLYTGCISDRGNFSKKNQDRAVCHVRRDLRHVLAVACVCDGIGSFAESEIASELVTSGISRWFHGIERLYPKQIAKNELLDDLEVTVQELNELVYDHRKKSGIDIGCTMSLLLMLDTEYYVFHVGDSRIYCVNETIYQITHDEVSVTESNGRLKTKLANYIGKTKELWINKFGGEAEEGDAFLLGSDGVFKKLEYDDVNAAAKKIRGNRQAQRVCGNFVRLVLARGERDNISCILLKISRIKRFQR